MDFYEDTKVTEIIDYKNSRVKKPNLFIEALMCFFGLMGIMLVLFVLVFSSEIVKLFE